MSIFSGIVVYVLIWWMVFFCSLPFGIQNIDKPQDGSMPGAPIDPGLKKKAIVATIISCVAWVIIYFIITSDLISFRSMAEKMAM